MQNQTRLLVNDEVHDHETELGKLLPEAVRMECMVAFAKTSGLEAIIKNLKAALAAGMEARFAIGLSFYLTEPHLLRELLKLGRRNRLELYLSNSVETFHPKIYALSHRNGCTVVIGSANLTGGGLAGNYEASALIADPEGQLMTSVSGHIDDLIADEVLVSATKARIDEYERLYIIHRAQQRLAMRRAEEAAKQDGIYLKTLREILQTMKDDETEDGFDWHRTVRRRNRKMAAGKIRELAVLKNLNAGSFLEHYEQLIGSFHSGGLHRSKRKIAKSYREFQRAMVAILGAGNVSPSEAYRLLSDHFEHIGGAGVNVITEVLHAIDFKRFAVMNQNAVSGLRLAGIHEFPSRPTKATVTAERYGQFCERANSVRKELGLADFTELDALFNYAYWGHSEDEGDDVDE